MIWVVRRLAPRTLLTFGACLVPIACDSATRDPNESATTDSQREDSTLQDNSDRETSAPTTAHGGQPSVEPHGSDSTATSHSAEGSAPQNAGNTSHAAATGSIESSPPAIRGDAGEPSDAESPTLSPSTEGQSSPPADRCADPSLTWRTGHKTNYESYPDPGSEECIEFNGCYWAGMFAGCDDKMPEEWVEAHNIVALFPNFDEFALHDLCLRRGNDVIVVTVYDTCADSDCDGCCSENQGSADALIDLEKYTNERWGLPDGDIEWADLGPSLGDGCD